MTTTMPAAVDSFSAKSSGGVVGSAHINLIQDALTVVEKAVVGPIWINVKDPDYGAVGDGSTDDAAAIQAAIDALTNGGIVFFPPGIYYCGTKLDLDTDNVQLWGVGAGASVIKVTSATQVGLDIDADRVKVRFLSLQHTSSTASAGAAIRLSGGGYAEIENVTFYGGWYRNLECIDGFQFVLKNCFLFDHVHDGVWHGQTTNSDRGDSIVEGCTIDTGSGGATNGVFWQSGGGFRFIGNKVLGHVNGFLADIAAGVATQGIHLKANAFENFTGYGVRVKRASGTPTVGFVELIGNEFDGTGDGISLESAGVAIATVTANNIRVGNTKTGINCGAGIVSTQVNGNVVNGALVGLNVGAAAQVAARGNSYYNCTSLVVDASGQDNASGPIEKEFEFHVNVASDSAYTKFVEIGLDVYSSATVLLNYNFQLAGVGEAHVSVMKVFRRAGGAITASDFLAAVATGSVFDVTYDTATVSGSVQIGVRRNSGAGGTAILGRITVQVWGSASVKAL